MSAWTEDELRAVAPATELRVSTGLGGGVQQFGHPGE
jgi:hypothetical protein